MRIPSLRILLLALSLAALLAAACGSDESGDAVAVRVSGVALDRNANAPVVLLEELEGERQLPIWIGVAEARSILAGLGEEAPVRPNTHDLANRLVEGLEARVRRIVVTALEDGIYYADVVLDANGRELRIDARPSDAIALALRAQAPLFVHAPLFRDELPEIEGEGRLIRGAPPAAGGRQLPGRSL